MKKFYLITILLTLFSVANAQNLLVNGDMETWNAGALDTWTFETGTTIEQETTTVNEGSSSAKFTVTTQSQGDTDFRQSISVEAGVVYDVSVDVYQEDIESRARLYVDGYFDYSDPSLTGQWQTITYEFTASTTGSIDVGLRFYDISGDWTGNGSVMYIDNFQFVEQSTTEPTLVISSPADGDNLAIGATSVNVEFAVQNFEIGETTDGLDGHLHYIVNGADQGPHFTTDPINVTGLMSGSNTIKLQLYDNSHNPISPEVSDEITVNVPTVTQVADLAALRADVVANGLGSIYEITGDVTVSYVVEDSFTGAGGRNQKYVQDATGGLLIDDPNGVITSTLVEGDAITGLIVSAGEFNGVLQGEPQENVTASSSGNMLTPTVVTIADYTANFEMYESMLVMFENVTFNDGGMTIAADTNYTFTDGSNTVDARAAFDMADYIGGTLPAETVNITAIAAEFNGTPQVYPRNLEDVEVLSVSDLGLTANKLQVYTTAGQLNISGVEAAQVNVYNMNGKLVNKAQGNVVSVASLPAGVYVARVLDTDGNVQTVKFIKK